MAHRRSWIVTLILCFFFGYFGIHRFYTGNWIIGLLQLCTASGAFVWWLIDMILILTGAYHDGDGNTLA